MAFTVPRLKAPSGEMLHLDLLRFVASAGIVFHHSREFFLPVQDRARIMSTRTGGLAFFVDLFFVISGFVIAYVYASRLHNGKDFIKFMQRRVGRLIPLHWLTLAVSLLIWFVVVRHSGHANHPMASEPACIADAAFLAHGLIPCGNGNFFNGQSWSISAEMFMYLLFPLTLLLSNLRRWLPLAVTLVVLFAIAAIHIHAGTFAYFSWEFSPAVVRALPSFLFGVALFNYRNLLAKLPLARPLLLVITVLLVAEMLADGPTFLTLLLVYLCGTFAVASDVQGKVSAAIRKTAPLGQLTYSIYLWHGIFILIIMNAIGDKILHGKLSLEIPLAIVCYVCIFIASYISFFYIETPARRWIDSLPIV